MYLFYKSQYFCIYSLISSCGIFLHFPTPSALKNIPPLWASKILKVSFSFQATIKNIWVHMVVRPHKMQQYEKTWIRWCNCIQLILWHYLGTQQFFLLFCFSFLDIAPNPVLIFHLHWSKLVKFGLGIWGYASKVELGYAIPWLLPYLHVGPGPHIIKISIVMFWNSTYVAYPQIAILNAWVLVSSVCRMIFS